MERAEVSLDGAGFRVEVASSPLEQMRGMRLRSRGRMFFRFRRRSRPLIDMALVRTGLWMYFVDRGEVVEKRHVQPWSMNPATWKPVRPEKPCEALIESSEPLPAGPGTEVEAP
jgi:uncharacterized membrane protein (UPF0127 family)